MIRLQGFRTINFSLVENSRWPPLLKIAELLKSSFSPEWLGIFGRNLDLDVDWYQNEKKSVQEVGYNGCLKIYVDPGI